MQAIAVVESGRRNPAGAVAAWPWTINVEGVGEWYESKADVIAAVRRHQAAGARSIDVGCMQVNLLHHPAAFPSLDDAFDPAANARYAARFLQDLLAQTGSWPRAVAGYHSLTPEVGAEYARKVLAVWARPEPTGRSALAQTGVPATGAPFSGSNPVPALPAPAPGRVLATATPLAAGAGRGLDAYRANPVRSIAAAGLRRF